MGHYWVGILVSFLISLLITPWVKKKALKWKAVDIPDARKVHRTIMPRMGGLGIYLAFAAGILIALPLNLEIIGLLVGMTLILLVGIWDDLKGMNAYLKFAAQIGAALIVIPFGLEVLSFTNPLTNAWMEISPWIGVPITVFWLVAVTNAVNLIDGLDGLASGVALIAALTMAAVAYTQFARGTLDFQMQDVVLPLLLAGAIAGFLPHNYHPAKIFLGDTGSLLLGFTLASVSIMSTTKGAAATSVIMPLIILALPLLDTLFAIVRRVNTRKPIFQPDKGHLHHCLLARGFSHLHAVWFIYAISLVMGILAVVLNLMVSRKIMIITLLITVLVILWGSYSLGIFGVKEEKKDQQKEA
ncbi:MAG: undecaprenyl/decaprenyl-phosphate alpha-N-acetylglucosaminyl 1-phosphate transferase [Clostridia bacterium]|nr:undecaprenyl/decaprenyl-phosphate alpha-N-acetylglucosaminyl 1-phosphate transferase [Clostridia bacterium]